MTETPEVQPPGANVPGYLLPLNILATLFCCLPVGILGIIFSVQARSNSQAGNYAAASAAVRRANISLISSVVLGILLITLVLVFGILGSIVALVSGSAGSDVSRDEDFALEDAVPKYVGDFRLQEVRIFQRAYSWARRKP